MENTELMDAPAEPVLMQEGEIAAPDPKTVALVNHPGLVGELRLHEFGSKVFRNKRYLRVWLPPGYNEIQNAGRKYPVFYLNDGQNLFEASTAFGGVKWAVDEAADRLIREGKIPSMIIVGIDNAQTDRLKEYLPYRCYSPTVMRPRGKKFLEFLVDEVMPFVLANYRVAPGAENCGFGGSSLGGLISLYAAMVRPGLFGKLLIESPSLFIANRKILKYVHEVPEWPEKVYLAIGTKECGREEVDRRVVEDVRNLERQLREAGLGEDRLRVNIVEGAAHSEGEWARRLPEAMQFLWGR